MPVKNYPPNMVGWWLNNTNYRIDMLNLIFEGNLRRPPRGLHYSVYQIIEFDHPKLVLATVSLFDLSPRPLKHGRREDLITINLKNYLTHTRVTPEDVLETMLKHNIDTQHLAYRGYIGLAARKS